MSSFESKWRASMLSPERFGAWRTKRRMSQFACDSFDDVTTVILGGSWSVKALIRSTEEEQFH